MRRPIDISFKVRRDEFPRIRRMVPQILDQELGACAAAIEAGARQRNREHGLIDTSNMINAWTHERIKALSWAAYTPVLYTVFWELGHRNHAPAPMLVPAANAALQRLVERLRRLEASL